MNVDDAMALIAPAVTAGGSWADLGAGGGTFTLALARLLGESGRVHALDRDASAVDALGRLPRRHGAAPVTALHVDFTAPAVARRLPLPLDGVLLANALHFVSHDAQAEVLARIVGWLGPGGRLVVVEYEGRAPNRWVPYPVPFGVLGATLPAALAAPARIGERGSAYGGTMYAAVAERVVPARPAP